MAARIGLLLGVLAFGLTLDWVVCVGLLLIGLPLAVSICIASRSGGIRALPGLVAAASFAVFFGSGLLKWEVAGRSIPFHMIGPVEAADALWLLLGLSLIVLALILGEAYGIRNLRPVEVSAEPRAMLYFTMVLVALAIAGAVLLVAQLGGLGPAMETLQRHNKGSISDIGGSLGLSLWATFAVPAGVAGAAGFFTSRTGKQRAWYASLVVVISGIAVGVFGSRLLVTLILVAAVGIGFTRVAGRLRLRHLGVGLAAMLVLSLYVYAGRDNSPARESQGPIENLLDLASYGLFDVSVAAWLDRSVLAAGYSSVDRAAVLVGSFVPSFGSGRLELEQYRIDVITVRAIGRVSQASTTGLPPSLPTVLLIGFALPVALGLAFALGALGGRITRVFLEHAGTLTTVLSGLWFAFAFNAFKGGDIALDSSSEIRRWIYMLAIYGLVILVLSPSRQRSAAGAGVG